MSLTNASSHRHNKFSMVLVVTKTQNINICACLHRQNRGQLMMGFDCGRNNNDGFLKINAILTPQYVNLSGFQTKNLFDIKTLKSYGKILHTQQKYSSRFVSSVIVRQNPNTLYVISGTPTMRLTHTTTKIVLKFCTLNQRPIIFKHTLWSIRNAENVY